MKQTNRRWLYLAAPYTNPDPVLNTHKVLHVANALIEFTGWLPIVPHTTLLWHAVTPRPIDYWYEYDLELLMRCDALLRLPGASTGADAEVVFAADTVRIPVYSLTDMTSEVIEAWRAFE